MDFAQHFGKRMRRARLSRGITQTDLAETAGVGANYVPRLERGEMVPSVEAAYRIARALGASLDELCGARSAGDDDELRQALGRLSKADGDALRRVADVVEAARSKLARPKRKGGAQ